MKGGRMIERMTEAEIAELNVRRINRDGTAEVLCTKAFYEITALRAEVQKLRAALTPSAETKAAYIGEFAFDEEYLDEDGNCSVRKITVPWTTVKEIMAAIRARAALEERQ